MISIEHLTDADRTGPCPRIEDTMIGATADDALELLRKAGKVFVHVKHGLGGITSTCRLTKADAKRWLTKLSEREKGALTSRLVSFDNGRYLFLGSIFDREDRK